MNGLKFEEMSTLVPTLFVFLEAKKPSRLEMGVLSNMSFAADSGSPLVVFSSLKISEEPYLSSMHFWKMYPAKPNDFHIFKHHLLSWGPFKRHQKLEKNWVFRIL